MRHFILFTLSILFVSCSSPIRVNTFIDVEYARVNETELLLDIFAPEGVKNPNLVVWIHGGGWVSGDKKNVPKVFVEKGYALVSINYRLTGVAQFPAQVHDVKAAIRFLRANASEYNIDAKKIVLAGSSAGGHLAALVGVTSNHEELEGTVGNFLNESSEVQGIIDFYGPTNFMTILHQSEPNSLMSRQNILVRLLGDLPANKPELSKLASPVFHVDNTDPPLLIMHGNKDFQVPIKQSYELENSYKEHDSEVSFKVIDGGGHGGSEFHTEENYTLVFEFLDKIFNNKK
ncbi:alpha/beta hydrolase [Sabulilitoribacter multivorans]|uniref:Alpha/beta hydrolase n=1 Tax=Flaviramulus multivorans TaxID=1304750 RepID=A0ABS9IJ51_9FLAO|nr:alpha/beta hydrolase [Flaviramulus multivorans]MCF7560500.1 alpha/beta hydrolase [Flaviramulus multivorans]